MHAYKDMHGESELFRVINPNTCLVGIIAQQRTVISVHCICLESLKHFREGNALRFELLVQDELKRIPNSSSRSAPVKWGIGSVFSR